MSACEGLRGRLNLHAVSSELHQQATSVQQAARATCCIAALTGGPLQGSMHTHIHSHNETHTGLTCGVGQFTQQRVLQVLQQRLVVTHLLHQRLTRFLQVRPEGTGWEAFSLKTLWVS